MGSAEKQQNRHVCDEMNEEAILNKRKNICAIALRAFEVSFNTRIL